MQVQSTSAFSWGLETHHHLAVHLEMTAISSSKILPSIEKL